MRKLRFTGEVQVGKEYKLTATVEGEGEAVSTVARIIWGLMIAGVLGIGGALFWGIRPVLDMLKSWL